MTELAEKLLYTIGGLPALMGKIRYGMISYGYSSAQKISSIAYVWGNNLAHKWATDEDFVRYLTIVEVNNLPIYQVSRKLAVMV
jgi:hypothetical protein